MTAELYVIIGIMHLPEGLPLDSCVDAPTAEYALIIYLACFPMVATVTK